MQARHTWLIMVAAGAVALGGCGGRQETPPPVAAATSASGHPAHHVEYLDALGEIDRGLVEDEDLAITRAEDTCKDIKDGMKGAALTDRVVERLSSGDTEIDAKQAGKIIPLMKTHICNPTG